MFAKIHREDFVNPNVINIFTDASMSPGGDNNGFVPGCYGFITMQGEIEINSGLYIDTFCTVNRAEIKGIKCAVLEAIRLRNAGFRGMINIFSDSQISVMGIREWIFNWNQRGNSLITSSGKEVANQSEFIEIVLLIVQYNPFVNFYHINGHINVHDTKSLYKAISTFKRSNMNHNTPDNNIDFGFIKFVSLCNNEIDNRTRWHLRNQYRPEDMIYRDAFKFIPMHNFNKQVHTYNIMTGGKFNV